MAAETASPGHEIPDLLKLLESDDVASQSLALTALSQLAETSTSDMMEHAAHVSLMRLLAPFKRPDDEHDLVSGEDADAHTTMHKLSPSLTNAVLHLLGLLAADLDCFDDDQVPLASMRRILNILEHAQYRSECQGNVYRLLCAAAYVILRFPI